MKIKKKNELECGCTAFNLIQDILKKDQVCNTLIKSFYIECKHFYFALLKKIKTSMLVGLSFLKRAAVLNTLCLVGMSKYRCVRHFTRLVENFVSMRIIKTTEGG